MENHDDPPAQRADWLVVLYKGKIDQRLVLEV